MAPPAPDPAVIVMFAGTPGLGKTAICAELRRRLGARHDVVHHHSDALAPSARKGYWGKAATASVTRHGGARGTVVLADKNLVDNPPGAHPLPQDLVIIVMPWQHKVWAAGTCLSGQEG